MKFIGMCKNKYLELFILVLYSKLETHYLQKLS